VAQANGFEALPGLRLNGELEVGENLADAGGVALGYAALQTYLRDHPSANRPVDGSRRPSAVSWPGDSSGRTRRTRARFARRCRSTATRQGSIARSPRPARARLLRGLRHPAGDRMWLDEAKRAVIW